MIFVTIGTQEPFDRLINAVDEIAPFLNGIEINAQVSDSIGMIKNMNSFTFLNPLDFNELFLRASLIISHAGMGTIISAMQNNKPIIIMPRSAKLGEHRNEHQLATAKRLDKLKYIHVAYNEKELKEKILAFYKGDLRPMHSIGKSASKELIESIHDYIKAK